MEKNKGCNVTLCKVWDWPLRLFHWLLVISVSACYITGLLGGLVTDWHGLLGAVVMGLLLFRIIWGLIGSSTARFINFIPTFSSVRAYLRGHWQGVGHNPLGSLAVIAILVTLLSLAVTGLFANDDIAFEGPLFHSIEKGLSDKLSGWHIWLVTPLLVIIALHVSALLFYLIVKKTNLIVPMLTGNKRLPVNDITPSIDSVNKLRCLASIVVAMAFVVAIWNDGFTGYLVLLAKM